MSDVYAGWNRRYGGRRWTVTPDGILVEGEIDVMRTPGQPVTARRLRAVWGPHLWAISYAVDVPLPILMMTVLTEGALRWTGRDFDYPVDREEPGYVSDSATPDKVSFGPMHVLLSTYREVMYAPEAGRAEATELKANLYAGAVFIAGREDIHGYDPILVAASYNAGGLYDASDPGSRWYNPWHLRVYGNHLDRSARWYGDALAALRENPAPPPPPRITRLAE